MNEELPSLPEQAKNATLLIAEVIKDAIKNNTLFVEDKERQRRYDICQACEFFVRDSKRCQKCGCFMVKKTSLTAAKCPVKKW